MVTNLTRLRFQKVLWFVYPLLLGYYPVLSLRNHNLDYVDFFSTIRSLLLVSAGVIVLTVVAYAILRDQRKASVIVSIINLQFLTYGHFYLWLGDMFGSPVRHSWLAGVQLILLLILALMIIIKKSFARIASRFLATLAVVLIFAALVESFFWDFNLIRLRSSALPEGQFAGNAPEKDKLPDFYLILLDGHTRSDVLKQRYDYDNSEFIEALTDLGFYVSSCSQSNYASTKLSLVSAFYVDYIDSLLLDAEVLPPLKRSALIQTLDAKGYTMITFANRAQGHFDLSEDIFLARNQRALGRLDLRGGISEFERMMLDTSFLRLAYETELIPGFDADTLTRWEWLEHYYQTKFILDELTRIPVRPGSKFIFAHLMVPHAPFIFAEDGTFFVDNNPIRGYRSNVAFIDNSLPPILKKIIETSDVPPIIIVMGDHGPSTRSSIARQMRMATLNAYFVNDEAKNLMYPTMTPINAFRIILNSSYGGNYPLLEDDSLYAYAPADLEDADSIPNECTP